MKFLPLFLLFAISCANKSDDDIAISHRTGEQPDGSFISDISGDWGGAWYEGTRLEFEVGKGGRSGDMALFLKQDHTRLRGWAIALPNTTELDVVGTIDADDDEVLLDLIRKKDGSLFARMQGRMRFILDEHGPRNVLELVYQAPRTTMGRSGEAFLVWGE